MFFQGKPQKNPAQSKPGFATHAKVRLGTNKAPAIVSVQSEEKKQELIALCTENNWASKIEVNPDQPENLRDIEILQESLNAEQASTSKQAGRNDPCPCGSGKKYKKCCA